MIEDTICDKCKELIEGSTWEKGVTYQGIDEHHNPPRFMFEKDEEWVGEIYNLCRKCHRELHDEIIKIINKHSETFKLVKSEHWAWIKTLPINRIKTRKKVYGFTNKWVKENDS